MTMTENPQRERMTSPQVDERTAQSERDRARREGNRIDLLANVAEQNLEAAEDERDDRTRYEDAFQVLRWLIGAEWAERTVDHDVVLHDEGGSLDREKVTEFIDLILSGHSSLQARKALLHRQRYGAQAEETRRAVAAAREVSGGLHRFADGPLVPAQRPAAPALPVGSAPSNGAAPPKRAPGPRPVEPPMFPPAPPESPAEQTGAIFSRLRENGHDIPAEIERAARKDHGTSLETRVPDPAFGASAVRIGDTQPMRMDEVLGHLAQNNAGKDDEAAEEHGGRLVPPFVPAAVEAGDASRRADAASGSGDGDDA